MLRSRVWMCLLLVGAMVGTVQARAVKIMDFVPVLNGETENADVDGLAILNYIAASGYTEARITVMGLAPATAYRVYLRGWGGGNTPEFETNAAGNGHVKTQYAGDITGGGSSDVSVMVYIDGNGDQMVQPEEIRSLGCVSGECTLPFTNCSTTADCTDSFIACPGSPNTPCLGDPKVCDPGTGEVACEEIGFFCTDEVCVAIGGQGYCSVTVHDCSNNDPCLSDMCISNSGETNGEMGSCDTFNYCP